MAGPGAGLTLPVALEEVAHTLGVPLLVLGLPLHDHNLPGQVANDAGRGEGGVPDLAKVLNLEGDDGLGPGLVPVVHSLPLLGRLCAAALLHGAASHGLLFRGGGGLRHAACELDNDASAAPFVRELQEKELDGGGTPAPTEPTGEQPDCSGGNGLREPSPPRLAHGKLQLTASCAMPGVGAQGPRQTRVRVEHAASHVSAP